MLVQSSDHIPRWSAQRTRRNSALLALAALIVVLLLGAAFAVDRLRVADRRQLERIDLLQVRLNEAFSLLREMENSQRGYLLTGDETFSEQYRQATTQYPDVIAQVRQLSTNEYGEADQITHSLLKFDEAAQIWQEQSLVSVEQHHTGELDSSQIQQTLAESRNLFDAVRSYRAEVSEILDDRRDQLQGVISRYVDASLVLLVLVTSSTLVTIGYSIILVRRVGLLASELQTRQESQEAYTQVITALNGPTHLRTLLQQVLPSALDSVGAQAGVVYSYEDGVLTPVYAVGLDHEALQPLKVNEGLPGRALLEGRTMITSDLLPEVSYRIQAGVGVVAPRSLINVPLHFGAQHLGVLTIASINRLDDVDVSQLELIASQLSTAISNVRAFEETRRIAEQLARNNESLERLLETRETLQEIGRELVMQSDLQAVLDLVCRETRRLLRADYAAVATIVEPQGSTRWVAIDGALSQIWRHTIFPPHTGLAGRAIDTAGPVVVHGAGQDASLPMEDLSIHTAEGMQSALGVPLFRKQTPIGALILAYRSEQEIGEGEVELAIALASYASIAIENARLVSELQRERDIAEARAQELTTKNVEVERANRLKSQFVANMSHELRTPLNSILALSQILLDRLDGDLNEEQEKQVRIIERNGRNLLRLINDILDLSKIEAGRVELAPSTVNLPDVIRTVRSTIAPLVADKGLTLQTELPPDLPPCRTDETKLKQILLNLLSNAVKFTSEGEVTLRVRRGREVGDAAQTREDSWITFEVQDTGIGIAPADQAAIWDEFHQIDGSLSRYYEGTGLGLTIVRRLVHLMGGQIELQSEVGRGSIFRFSLPMYLPDVDAVASAAGVAKLAAEDAAPAPDAIEAAQAPARPLVLVVDDDIEVIYILEKYLRDEGYRIAVAHSGEEALRKARQLQPFAITLDVMLPEPDGWKVVRELKQDQRTSDIPIIMLTMLDNRQFGYSLGATDYLVKPVSRHDLLRCLERIRDSKPLQTALLVDDDPVELRILSTALRDQALNVAAFRDGQAALKWLAAHQPDLIVLDLMLPGVDGFAILDVVRTRGELKHVPVLVVAAKELAPEEQLRLDDRITTVIRKGPQEREALLHELRETLKRRLSQRDEQATLGTNKVDLAPA